MHPPSGLLVRFRVSDTGRRDALRYGSELIDDVGWRVIHSDNDAFDGLLSYAALDDTGWVPEEPFGFAYENTIGTVTLPIVPSVRVVVPRWTGGVPERPHLEVAVETSPEPDRHHTIDMCVPGTIDDYPTDERLVDAATEADLFVDALTERLQPDLDAALEAWEDRTRVALQETHDRATRVLADSDAGDRHSDAASTLRGCRARVEHLLADDRFLDVTASEIRVIDLDCVVAAALLHDEMWAERVRADLYAEMEAWIATHGSDLLRAQFAHNPQHQRTASMYIVERRADERPDWLLVQFDGDYDRYSFEEVVAPSMAAFDLLDRARAVDPDAVLRFAKHPDGRPRGYCALSFWLGHGCILPGDDLRKAIHESAEGPFPEATS